MKYLLIIAIEDYSDKKLGHVPFVLNDAKALIDAMQEHGYAKPGQYIMLNEDATKTAIESRVRRLARQLATGDELVVYYAGHGLNVSGHNVITARDSQYVDFDSTTIRLTDIFTILKKSACRRITFFLDACHTGVEVDPCMRGIHTQLTDDELREFFDAAEYCVCFAACQADESSYSSGHIKHGIWTYHLVEALRGDASLALERGNRLTSQSLQNYLSKEVPRTLRKTYNDGRTQTPWIWGGATGEFLIADLTDILAARTATAPPTSAALGHISLSAATSLDIRRLSGFKPSHRVPKNVDSYTESFVEKIGTQEVQDDLDETYKSIRDGLGFKRRDLEKDYSGGSTGSIITPAFDYHVSLKQDPDEPSNALMERVITGIRAPQVIMSDEFQDIFNGVFNMVEFNFPRTIKVAALIDQIEEIRPKGLELSDYDDECTFCDLNVTGIDGTIRIRTNSVEITGRGRQTPRQLIELFSSTWTALLPAAPKGMLELPAPKDSK